MSKPSDGNWDDLRRAVLGLGAASSRKTHYPGLRQRVAEAERFRSVMDLSGDLLIVLDTTTGIVLDVNEAVVRRLGRSSEEIVGRPAAAVLPAECARALDQLAADYQAGRRDQATLNATFSPAVGDDFPVEISVRCGSAGASHYTVLAGRDISERLQAAEALRASQERFRTIIDSVHDAIAVWDAATLKVTWVNERLAQMYGFPQQDGTRIDWVSFCQGSPPYSTVDAMDWLRKAREEGPQLFEWHARRAGGDLFWMEVDLRRVSLLGRDSMLMSGRDISLRKSLEQNLLEAQKLEAIGLLAGGVAHDFNNLLTVINGYAELLAAQLEADDALAAEAREIRNAGARAADLTRQLLAFSRRQILEPRRLDLNAILREAESMLRGLAGESIALSLSLAPELPPIEADPSQLLQVFIAMAAYAREAMPAGGRLELSTSICGDDDCGQGRYASLRVSDSSPGMDDATRARIFEPFFSPRGLGQGGGLGLAAVYGIVRQTGGHITVESAIGQGTTFDICLPLAAGLPAAPAPAEQTPAATGNETILLVEDQAEVRRFVSAALAGSGYSVLESSRGDEALALCRSFTGRIDLLISDVVMPGLSGPQLVDAARIVRPEMCALLITGYAGGASDDSAHLAEASISLLRKPFGPRELAEKVRQVLDAHAPA